jgi:hypothetical protein
MSEAIVTRESVASIGAVAIAVALVALAYLVAPRACQGGLEIYVVCGGVALLVLSGLPFAAQVGRSMPVRIALAAGFLTFGAGAWLAGLFAANVRFICGLGYL